MQSVDATDSAKSLKDSKDSICLANYSNDDFKHFLKFDRVCDKSARMKYGSENQFLNEGVASSCIVCVVEQVYG